MIPLQREAQATSWQDDQPIEQGPGYRVMALQRVGGASLRGTIHRCAPGLGEGTGPSEGPPLSSAEFHVLGF